MSKGILGHGEAFDYFLVLGLALAAFAWATILITRDNNSGGSGGSFLDHTGNDAITGRPTSPFS